jgi:hypothetical protein
MPTLIMAASLLPIFGSGVDMGLDIGGVSASDIAGALGAPAGIPPGAKEGAGAAAPAERLPRINSINLSEGTPITNSFVAFVPHTNVLSIGGSYLSSNCQ